VEVAGVWEELFDTGPLGLDDEFFALGGTSLSALRMIERIGARLHRALPLNALVAGATVQRIARVLANTSPESESPLVRFRPGHDRPPLICIHPGGGSALCYLELARRLPSSQPVYGIQEPAGVSEREPSVEDRASAYLRDILVSCPLGPWHLAGHSFGGLVAFEIARQLTAVGRAPGIVALIDTPPPVIDGARVDDPQVRRLGAILEHGDLDEDVATDPEEERRMWMALADFAGGILTGVAPQENGDTRFRLGAIERFCRRYHFLPMDGALGYVELRRFLRAMRSAFRSARRYAPAPYAGRVTLLQATDSSSGSQDEVKALSRRQVERWSAIVTGGLDVHEVPGHHFDLLGPPHIEVLAARIAAMLEAASPANER
jgi:thioesterase domain-containing protein